MFKLSNTVTRKYCGKVPLYKSASKNPRIPQVGERVSVDRTITEEELTTFARLTDDFNPVHTNSSLKIVHGALLNGFLSGVLGMKLPGPGTIVAEQLIRYPNPCYAGDTVRISVQVLSVRKIIKCGYSIVANSERIVLEGEGKFVMKDSSPA